MELELILLLVAISIAVIWFFLRDLRPRTDGPVPVISGRIPWIGVGLNFAVNARNYLEQIRHKYGDNFILRMWGRDFFFTFSARGLKELYQLPEDLASFPRATQSHKVTRMPLASGVFWG